MRTRKALLNAIVIFAYQIISIICGLIVPRYILLYFGSTYNGVISSATQFLELTSLLTLGIAGATRVALYKPLAVEDHKAISAIFKSNQKYMHKVGICTLIYIILLCLIYPFVSHNSLSNSQSAMLIAIVGIGVFAQYYFGVSSQTLLSADQSTYIYYLIMSVATSINAVITVLLIKSGFSIFIVKFAGAIIFFLSPLILNCIVRKKYNLSNDVEEDKSPINNRGAVAFHSIANIVHDNTDLVILTLFTDAKVISVYSVYRMIIAKVRSFLLMLTNGLEGSFGNMWAKNEYAAFERNFRFFEYLIYLFTSIVFSCVGVLVLPFVKLYTSGITDINYLLFDFALLMTVTETVHCIRHPYLILVQATGNYEATKKGAMAEAIINITVSLVLVSYIGLNGVIIGTLIANAFRTIQYSVFISRHIIIGSLKTTIHRFIWFVSNIALTVSIQLLILNAFHLPETWIGWIEKSFISLFIALIVSALFSSFFYRNENIRLLKIIFNKRI